MRVHIVRHVLSHTLAATPTTRLASLILAGLFATGTLCAQQPRPSAQPGSTPKSSKSHAPSTAKTHRKMKAAQAIPPTPPEPPKPNWPVNNAPAPATISWDSHGLRIHAANSSLQQILQDVATATGTTVDGAVQDQRVFGTYGPGPAREVLFQLLQGSGYNVLMIGDRSNGTPSRIELTARSSTAQQPPPSAFAQKEPHEEEPAEPEPEETPVQPVPPPAARPGFPPGTPGQPVPPNIQQMQQMQQRMSQPNI